MSKKRFGFTPIGWTGFIQKSFTDPPAQFMCRRASPSRGNRNSVEYKGGSSGGGLLAGDSSGSRRGALLGGGGGATGSSRLAALQAEGDMSGRSSGGSGGGNPGQVLGRLGSDSALSRPQSSSATAGDMVSSSGRSFTAAAPKQERWG